MIRDDQRKSKVGSNVHRSFRLVKGHLGWLTVTWPEWCRLLSFGGSYLQKNKLEAAIRQSLKHKGCYSQITLNF